MISSMISDIRFTGSVEQDRINVLVFTNDSCNMDCSYCYNERPRTGRHIDGDRLFRFLQVLANSFGRKIYIELIGGEPSIYQDLEQFLENLDGLDYTVSMYTNLKKNVRLYEHLLSDYKWFRLFVTWHYNTSSDFLEKLKSLKTFKDRVDVSIMFEKISTVESKMMFDEVSRLGFRINTALIDSDRGLYTEKQLEIFESMKEKESDEYIVKFRDGHCEQLSEEDIATDKRRLNCFRNWVCNAGFDYIYIHFDGNVYPCQTFRTENKDPIMSIYDENISDDLIRSRFHRVICGCDICECGYNIKKKPLT